MRWRCLRKKPLARGSTRKVAKMQDQTKSHPETPNEAPWPIRGAWTPGDLQRFERVIETEYNRGAIAAPVHLSGGNEEFLIKAFEDIGAGDWVCSTWRSHYHCLLHGVDPDKLYWEIMAGKSITLTFPENRIITSAIVGGICPIALGIAMALKRRQQLNRVWCFVGDMTGMTGIFHECVRYAHGHDLPITFIVEDNDLSVCTNTSEVWGTQYLKKAPIKFYNYKLPWPHAGAGKRINF